MTRPTPTRLAMLAVVSLTALTGAGPGAGPGAAPPAPPPVPAATLTLKIVTPTQVDVVLDVTNLPDRTVDLLLPCAVSSQQLPSGVSLIPGQGVIVDQSVPHTVVRLASEFGRVDPRAPEKGRFGELKITVTPNPSDRAPADGSPFPTSPYLFVVSRGPYSFTLHFAPASRLSEVQVHRVLVQATNEMFLQSGAQTEFPLSASAPQVVVNFGPRRAFNPAAFRALLAVVMGALLVGGPLALFALTPSWAWRPRGVLMSWLVFEEISLFWLMHTVQWSAAETGASVALGAFTPLVVAWALPRPSRAELEPPPEPASEDEDEDLWRQYYALLKNYRHVRNKITHVGGKAYATYGDVNDLDEIWFQLSTVLKALEPYAPERVARLRKSLPPPDQAGASAA